MSKTDKRPRYECTCPVCGRKFWACKSIFHEMGLHEYGGGTCPGCKTFLRLVFNPEIQSMNAINHPGYQEGGGETRGTVH